MRLLSSCATTWSRARITSRNTSVFPYRVCSALAEAEDVNRSGVTTFVGRFLGGCGSQPERLARWGRPLSELHSFPRQSRLSYNTRTLKRLAPYPMAIGGYRLTSDGGPPGRISVRTDALTIHAACACRSNGELGHLADCLDLPQVVCHDSGIGQARPFGVRAEEQVSAVGG